MKSIGGVVLAVVILLVMVTIHEFGHYIAGKILGFKINEFAVGFGPAIFKKRSKKTGELFALRIIPLGGYCAFDGEDEYEEEEQSQTTEEPPFEEISQNEGGKVEVSLKRQGNSAVVCVRDTGCGISAETGAHIFDKFYQGDTSHAQEGNGLGLALVKKVIDLLGGKISVESELGKGTAFTVVLKDER